ncbi:MAG: exodeoxyribonuclease III [Bacteroidota bacterium]
MLVLTYNVNGLRSAISKGFLTWLQATNADVVCLQEIKSHPDDYDLSVFHLLGYKVYWHPAVKKGYSGTALLCKQEPLNVEIGCGMNHYDMEGRIIRADFENVSVASLYLPSGSSGEERQAFKFQCMDEMFPYFQELKAKIPNIIIGGDYNICHRPIDIHNPKSNANSSGFLPAEREWMEKLLSSGFTDTFRHFNPEPHNYTWWSFRANSRAKNLGWRIDYLLAGEALNDRLVRAAILPEAKHSDHCPSLVEIRD